MKKIVSILLTIASILIVFSILIFASGTIDESLPSLIKRIEPSTVIIFTYDDKGDLLQLGSGFFISQNGDVITNYHVLQGASSAEIKTADEKTYPITYMLAGDKQNDIIRLSVNISSKYVYPLSLSKTIPEVGERIIVYGSPLGWENTVSDGIVSAIRDIPDYGRIIQITAPISPGSSGSPVLNMQGEVIGIATFQSIEGQNLNFAIPSDKINSLILTKENKISIAEEFFWQDSKAKSIQKSPVPNVEEADTYALRDMGPAGGLIFYDKGNYSDGWRYLEAAPVSTEWTNKPWAIGETWIYLKNSTKKALIGATGTAIGTGHSNTTIIVTWLNSHSETECAAQLCDALVYGGYSDWFLPAQDELNLMYVNLKRRDSGGFANKNYWSSSESIVYYAWYQDFNDGWKYNFFNKRHSDCPRVRAIRAF